MKADHIIYACVWVCAVAVRGQKIRSPGIGWIQVAVNQPMWVPGAELWSSGRRANTLNCWVTSPPSNTFYSWISQGPSNHSTLILRANYITFFSWSGKHFYFFPSYKVKKDSSCLDCLNPHIKFQSKGTQNTCTLIERGLSMSSLHPGTVTSGKEARVGIKGCMWARVSQRLYKALQM